MSTAKGYEGNGFHLTYEELKLRSPKIIYNGMKLRFHLTYEELKLNVYCHHRKCMWRFHLTYEELKLDCVFFRIVLCA